MIRIIFGHYSSLRARSGWPFFWRAWIEMTILSYGLIVPITHFVHFNKRKDLDGYSPLALIIMAVILGPLLETLIFQALPIGVLRAKRRTTQWQFSVSVTLFGAPHFLIGVPTGLSAGLIGGSYFAFTYLKFREASFLKAVCVTTALHGAYNLVGVVLMLVSKEVPTVNRPNQALERHASICHVVCGAAAAPARGVAHL
jgi:hypothetical protein